MSYIQKSASVFESSEFVDGFINFCDSDQYRKYMVPFLTELIEMHRAKLETAEDFKDWQSRLKAVRFIAEKSDALRFGKEMVARGE
jgi:hypothetical protein